MRILAVTVLTSLDRGDLDDGLIRPGDVAEIVVERAARAFEAGADGVIASPREAAAIRALPESAGRLIVTPGVRPSGAAPGDQKRIATPAEARAAGADHVVVGTARDARAGSEGGRAGDRGRAGLRFRCETAMGADGGGGTVSPRNRRSGLGFRRETAGRPRLPSRGGFCVPTH